MAALGTDELTGFFAGETLAVSSSNVATIAWDEKRHVLTVGFINGGTYEYPGIGREMAHSLASASSKGQWIDQHLRQTKHAFTKL